MNRRPVKVLRVIVAEDDARTIARLLHREASAAYDAAQRYRLRQLAHDIEGGTYDIVA